MRKVYSMFLVISLLASVACGALEYDFRKDGIIDFKDFALFAQGWGTNYAYFDIAPAQPDGQVNFLDLSEFAGHWLANEGPYLQDAQFEACNSESMAVSQANEQNVKVADVILSTYIEVDGRFINFHDDVSANCCIDGLDFLFIKNGNVIALYEKEIGHEACLCLCTYPSVVRMGPFEPGDYVLDIYFVPMLQSPRSIGNLPFTIAE